MTTTEPEREAEKVADATATIGSDRYHVDLQAGRAWAGRRRAGRPRRGRHRPLTVGNEQRARLAEIAEKTPVTRTVRAGTEIRITWSGDRITASPFRA